MQYNNAKSSNPGQTVNVKDQAAYGLILLQGCGKMGVWDVSTPTIIKYGELTDDEFFVTEPIVMLNHFAENPE